MACRGMTSNCICKRWPLELNLTMTNEGMQFEVVNTSSGQKTRQTMTWDQVFAK